MRRSTSQRGEDGYALVAVLATMLGLALFATLAMAVAVRATAPSRSVGDVVTATAAAQAGIDEYVARLAANPTYYSLNGTGDDPDNRAFVTRRDGTAFPAAAGPRDPLGVRVPGTGTAGAYFRYQLLTSPTETAKNGTIRLRVTGTTPAAANQPAESRTLTATLQQPGFLQYIYVTDVEAVDPALYGNGDVVATVNGSEYRSSGSVRYYYRADPATAAVACATRYYESRQNPPTYVSSSTRPYYEVRYDIVNNRLVRSTAAPTKVTTAGRTVDYSCQNIQFGGGDVIAGALHSNDALFVGGTVTFQSPRTTTSWADGATPAPAPGRRWWTTTSSAPNVLGNQPTYAPPVSLPTTNDDLKAVAGTAGLGCTYSGETRIRFDGSSMKVLSPQTTSAPAECLNTSAAARQQEQTVAVPSVIYVRDASTTCSPLPGFGYPVAGEDTTGQERRTTTYGCKNGNAFVQGNLNGQVTLATERDVVVTGDLTYAGGVTGTDVLGLIPNGYAWVHNPVDSNGDPLAGYTASRRIDAAILSLQHSFLVQNWRDGASRGTLTVNGTIAQKFRGAVGTPGTPGTGFTKKYVYDERLRYLPPPFFLAPESTPWAATRVTDG